jgi:hypothetical protein
MVIRARASKYAIVAPRSVLVLDQPIFELFDTDSDTAIWVRKISNPQRAAELLARYGVLADGADTIDYEGFNLGATTLNQIRRASILPKQAFAKGTAKPDGLVVNRRRDTPEVKLIIEYKDYGASTPNPAMNIPRVPFPGDARIAPYIW